MHAGRCRIAALWIAFLACCGSVLGAEAPGAAAVDHTPTLAEIAQANDSAWAAIRSVDLIYDRSSQFVVHGNAGRAVRSNDLRWTHEGNRERLTGRFHSAEWQAGDFAPTDRIEYRDDFIDGVTLKRLYGTESNPAEQGELTCFDQKGLRAEILPAASRRLAIAADSPELLHYLRWSATSAANGKTGPELCTLSELVHSREWSVALRGKQTAGNGDTLWLIHAEPQSSAGESIDIDVNASKNYLMQKIVYNMRQESSSSGQSRLTRDIVEVEEFQEFDGVYFPKRVTCRASLGASASADAEDGFCSTFTASRLSVNMPLAADVFDFRFPENAVVMEWSAEDQLVRILLWGADNTPAQEFPTSQAFEAYVEAEQLAVMDRQVAAKRASNAPADLVERGVYDLLTKKYDAAVATLSMAIADDESLDDARFMRGVAYLCGKADAAKAAADFTAVLQHSPESDTAAMCHYLRGLAYADQPDGLKKATDEMSAAIRLDPNVEECLTGAHLVRCVASAREGRLDTAIADATRVIELDPEEADAFALRASLYEKKADGARAAADRATARQLAAQTRERNGVEALFAMALQRCLRQLVPNLDVAAGVPTTPTFANEGAASKIAAQASLGRRDEAAR